MNVAEAKHRIGDIRRLGDLLNWPLAGVNPEHAWWRGNIHSPALSIFADDQLWKDHATGDSGDMVDLLARVEKLSKGHACKRLIQIAEGVVTTPPPVLYSAQGTREEKRALWPKAWRSLDWEEEQHLARQRRFPHFAGVRAASARGLLVPPAGYDGDPWPVDAWGITDSAREGVQIRRMDGKPWRLGKSKSLPGSLGGWPIGIAEVGERKDIVLTEGEPDLLAAITLHCLLSRDPVTLLPRDPGTFGFCAMVGAAKKIAAAALPLFKGKTVCIVPHADSAGNGALDVWGDQLLGAGATVRVFDLTGLLGTNAKPAKDLNDVVTEAGFASHRDQLAQLFAP